MKADLHIHSTASDGVFPPQALVEQAAGLGISVMALTDHDTVAGVDAAQEAGRRLGVRVIAGVELSCGAEHEIHVLGYGLNVHCEAMLRFCRGQAEQRERRVLRMLERLHALGKPVSDARVRALSAGVMGRPHIARALVEAGHVASVQEAFDHYLKPGRPAYEPKVRVSVGTAIGAIRGAGGLAVLAHPMELRCGEATLASLVAEWKAQGLEGIEVWHPSAQDNHARALLRLAREEGLLITGGSDFHGGGVHRGGIGEGLERWTTVDADVTALLEALSARV